MTDTSPAGAPEVQVTGGNPDPEELAAIVAAVQVMTSTGPAAAEEAKRVSRWRFSGRWWSRPIQSRRDRPSTL